MTQALKSIIRAALDDVKADNVVEIDVQGVSDVSDLLVIASGTSNRHVRSLAANVVDESKKAGFRPLGVEGEDAGDWVLVDFGDIVVHVMQPETRSFYELEKLWSKVPASRKQDR